jgi:hypothetical protein
MNRKFFDRANKRLEVARDSIVDGGEAAGQSMSYHERSEKFQNLAIENVKDYFQQFERFSVGASVLAQRMMEKYKDLPVGQMMPKDPPV